MMIRNHEGTPMKFSAIISSLVALLAVVAVPEAAEPNEEAIARLVAQLGSSNSGERDKAEAALLALKKMPEQLREASKSADRETRTRATRIISVFDGRVAALPFARVERLAKEGRFDEAVEHAVRWGAADPGGKNLLPLVSLARKLRQLEEKRFERLEPRKKKNDYPYWVEDMVEFHRDLITFYSSEKAIDREVVQLTMMRGAGLKVKTEDLRGFLASAGPVTVDSKSLALSIIFACDSVKVKGQMLHATIIADGDVEISSGPFLINTLIIARGNVKIGKMGAIRNSVILAGGTFDPGKTFKPKLSEDRIIIRENDLSGLGLVKFFDPKAAGIEVEAGTGGVKVKHLGKDRPFAKQLRVGDVVTAIDRTASPTPEAFRRVLRKALANVGSDMVVSVMRDGKTVEVKIPVGP